jgi:POT family proton-dependent oligopeptide transporter
LPHEVAENRNPIAWGRVVPIGLGVAAVLTALGGTGKLAVSAENLSNAFGLLLLMTVVTVFAVMFSSGSWTPEERRRLVVIVALFAAATLFWSSFEQAGSTLNLFAQRNTDSSIAGLSFPSSWYQSLNSLFLIGLAPGVAWLWVRLGDRQPSVPMKFVLGLFFVGVGFVVLAAASSLSASGGRVGPGWLIATYFLHTVGELCLSPVGLSAITKLAPARMGGLMMGAWFLSNAVGNFTGGRLAGFYETLPLTTLFVLVASVGLGGALLLLLVTGRIARLMGGVR